MDDKGKDGEIKEGLDHSYAIDMKNNYERERENRENIYQKFISTFISINVFTTICSINCKQIIETTLRAIRLTRKKKKRKSKENYQLIVIYTIRTSENSNIIYDDLTQSKKSTTVSQIATTTAKHLGPLHWKKMQLSWWLCTAHNSDVPLYLEARTKCKLL